MAEKALLIGATGLIGKVLLQDLLKEKKYVEVIVLTRRETGVRHSKLTEKIVDFDQIQNYKEEIRGTVLFSTLGTTLKSAGSKERQYEIDYHMQYNTAELAHENGVKELVLLSSAGANSNASNFYTRMKGELDEAVQKIGFESVSIIRPSMLTGDRDEFRWSEKIGTPIMRVVCWIPGLWKYRPIKDKTVACAMLNAANRIEGVQIYALEEVFKLAGK